jgi:hypothetical protein
MVRFNDGAQKPSPPQRFETVEQLERSFGGRLVDGSGGEREVTGWFGPQ